MLQVITPEIINKLGELGFEQEEINTFQKIHELKIRPYSIDIDINKLMRETRNPIAPPQFLVFFDRN